MGFAMGAFAVGGSPSPSSLSEDCFCVAALVALSRSDPSPSSSSFRASLLPRLAPGSLLPSPLSSPRSDLPVDQPSVTSPTVTVALTFDTKSFYRCCQCVYLAAGHLNHHTLCSPRHVDRIEITRLADCLVQALGSGRQQPIYWHVGRSQQEEEATGLAWSLAASIKLKRRCLEASVLWSCQQGRHAEKQGAATV
ncbi:hypothetical protein N658DRAFT_207665 [Parathielavia hyrcaniae]|uniref:Uncharacterized protein n=1 Tax=Parathielavia hyrcaniae TaxID=113614 RepID=A0AAN6PYF2_9PEZI|nr:hypothetical protein N658DRAFT_207665 [Parathielavia hyrcaniae]